MRLGKYGEERCFVHAWVEVVVLSSWQRVSCVLSVGPKGFCLTVVFITLCCVIITLGLFLDVHIGSLCWTDSWVYWNLQLRVACTGGCRWTGNYISFFVSRCVNWPGLIKTARQSRFYALQGSFAGGKLMNIPITLLLHFSAGGRTL